MERARKMPSMVLKKQFDRNLERSTPTGNENNLDNSAGTNNKVQDLSVNQDFQNVKENGGNAVETQNTSLDMEAEGENSKHFDNGDSLLDPDFVPSDPSKQEILGVE